MGEAVRITASALTEAALFPAVASAVAAEWARIRGDEEYALAPQALTPQTRIGGDVLPADSLDLLRLASAVGAQFALADQGLDDYLLRRRSLGDWTALAAAALARPEAQVTFSTSGTTGAPRQHRHALAALLQEARWLHANLPAFQRVVTMAPPHHIYGFIFGVLLPRISGTAVEHAAGVGQWRSADMQGGDLVVAFPSFWQYQVALGRRLPKGAIGVSSTAPLPADIAREAAGDGTLVEVFGSSETAGLGIRQGPDAPFQLMDHWRRGPDEDLQRQSPDGIWQRHPGPDDALAWEDTRHFYPCGRRDGAVQVGGVNVHPMAVAERLSQHPDVHACHIRPGGADLDGRLKAFVVPRAGVDWANLPAELERWCRQHLPAAERPVSFTLGTSLPRGPMGKLRDW